MSYVDTWRMGHIHYYVDPLCTGTRAPHMGGKYRSNTNNIAIFNYGKQAELS